MGVFSSIGSSILVFDMVYGLVKTGRQAGRRGLSRDSVYLFSIFKIGGGGGESWGRGRGKSKCVSYPVLLCGTFDCPFFFDH